MKVFWARQAAVKLGISKQTLIRYEKKGIFPKPRRNCINSWREYTQEDIEDFKHRLKKGITLIEMIMVIVIAGIIFAASIPRLRGLDSLKINGAAKTLASDIRYAQQVAISRHTNTSFVFDVPGDTYTAYEYLVSGSWQKMRSPVTGGDLSVDFKRDPRYGGVGITSASFNGTAYLNFTWDGSPSAGGSVRVDYKGEGRDVLVEDSTGFVRMQ